MAATDRFTAEQIESFRLEEERAEARKETFYRLASNGFGLIGFLGAWTYCTVSYGFLWGFGFGWVPALILAALLRFVGSVAGRVIYYGWPFAILYVIFTGQARAFIEWISKLI